MSIFGWSVIAGFTSAAIVVGQGTVWATPELRIPDPLTYRLRTMDVPPLAFTVFVTEGTLGKLRVSIRDAKGPGGIPLRPELIAVSAGSDVVTVQGTGVELRPDTAAFVATGDYTATLVVEAEAPDRKPVVLPKALTLIREKAELDLDGLRDTIIRVHRPRPTRTAPGERVFDVVNNGPGSLRALTILARPVVTKEGKQLSSAVLTVARADGKTDPVNIRPGEAMRVKVSLSGADTAGAFTTGLAFHSPSFERPASVTLGLEVTDRWPVPFLAILLGVLTAWLVSFVSERWRPLQEDKLRMANLTTEIERRRQLASAAATLQEIERIESLVRRAEERMELGDHTGASAQLEEAERAFATLRQADATARAAGWQRLTALRDKLGRLPANLTAEQTSAANEVRNLVTAAEALLASGRVEAAGERLAEGETKAVTLPTAPAGDGGSSARFGRGAGPGGLGFAPVSDIAIVVVEPEEFITADGEVTFRVDDPDNLLQAGDVFVWSFGDGSGDQRDGREIRHRFAKSGRMLVRLSVLRGTPAISQFAVARAITVALGAGARRRAGILRALNWAELALVVISIVVATVTGLWALYFGKVFGTGQDYAAAFLWGVGIDASVRGFSAVVKRLRG